MARYDDLLAAVCQTADDKVIFAPIVRKAVQLEEKLEYLESLPHIMVHPKDPTKQKTLPAFKQYKELLQQYRDTIRTLSRVTVEDDNTAESPLRTWAKARAAGNADM